MEHLTGFVWWGNPDADGCATGCWGPTDLARNARWGIRELAGGTDGYDSLEPVHAPQPLRALAHQELAWQAAEHVVIADLALGPEDRRLLKLATGRTDDAAVLSAQVAELHRALLGEDTSEGDSDLAATEQLWLDRVEQTGDPTRAWIVVVASLLQSPELVVY